MTDKRFKHSEIIQDDGQCICWGIEDTTKNHIHNMVDECTFEVSYNELINLVNEFDKEIMDLRWENTRFKLIIKEIIEDLEKQAESKEPIIISKKYVQWIKNQIDLKLTPEK